MPSLIPFNQAPVCSTSSDLPPPLLRSVTFNSKNRMPNFLVINCQSLCNKMEEFEVIIRQNSIPVIAVTETWNLDRLSGHMAGYEIFLSTRADRGEHRLGGGVALYIRKDIPCKLLPELFDPVHEVIWAICKPKSLPRRFSCIIVGFSILPGKCKKPG